MVSCGMYDESWKGDCGMISEAVLMCDLEGELSLSDAADV